MSHTGSNVSHGGSHGTARALHSMLDNCNGTLQQHFPLHGRVMCLNIIRRRWHMDESSLFRPPAFYETGKTGKQRVIAQITPGIMGP